MSEIPFDGFYKPGGTLTATFDHINSRYHSQSADKLGRWSTITLSGKKGRLIHILTVYQVVDKASTGPYTVYQQQLASLQLINRSITPCVAFLADLTKHLHQLRKHPESEIILMGDINEVVGHDASGFAQITRTFDLVDIMAHFHSLDNEVPTYACGTSCLDYVFCSSTLLPAVQSCGVQPFNTHIFFGSSRHFC